MTRALCLVLTVFWFILLARIILSWVMPYRGGGTSGIVGLIYDITDPVLRPFRNLIPPIRMGAMALDLSPIILFIVIAVLQGAVCR